MPANPQAQIIVSVVVPVFNVGSYIHEGLSSLKHQDFDKSYEIILVDDCSTDNSLAVCRQFASSDPHLFILLESETNAGVSVARNLGLARARGRYLMFVDPDDVLPASALRHMVTAAEQYDADIVKGNLVLFDDKQQSPAPDWIRSPKLVKGDEVLIELFLHTRVRGHIGGKMYRRDRFGGLRFSVGVRMAQDLLFFSELFSNASSLLLLNQEVYCYRKHQTGSTGRKYQKGSYIDWLNAVEQSGRFAENRRQYRAHKNLLLRSMTQIARECRKLSAAYAAPVLTVIEAKIQQWHIGLFHLIVCDRLGLHSISRYIKLQLALHDIRRKLPPRDKR